MDINVRSSDNIKKKTVEEKVDTEAINALNNSDAKPEPKKKSMGSKVCNCVLLHRIIDSFPQILK